MNMQPLHDMYEEYCSAEGLNKGLSWDEQIDALPESPRKERQRQQLLAFGGLFEMLDS